MASYYTVARSDGENREYNLTMAETAHRILTDDGCDYELRLRADGDGFDLWSRQQTAGRGWTRTHWFSLEQDHAAAEADIFARVVADSGASNWRGMIAEDQDRYRATLLERLEEVDEAERDFLQAEIDQMRAP